MITDDFITYEQRLNHNSRWALIEGSQHFEKSSQVFQTLTSIAKQLSDLKIPYAVVGGMALFHHGLRRFTEDVVILVTPSSLQKIHESLSGLGYLPPFANSKNLRDTKSGVKIEFLTTGDFPGDGKPKPVSFPDPSLVSEIGDEISYVNLPTLIELKTASGMTNPRRMKDLADVIELIANQNLSLTFADSLNPYVRKKFVELWTAAQNE